MQTSVFERTHGNQNQTSVCKALQKTKFPVAMEIETKPKPIPNQNERVGF